MDDFAHVRQNNIVDNMVVVEVAHGTTDNMDYNTKDAENMTHIASHNYKFDQLIFFPF